MPTDPKERIWDYVVRIHGPMDRDTFEAIYEASIAHHIWGPNLSAELTRSIVIKHRPKIAAPGAARSLALDD